MKNNSVCLFFAAVVMCLTSTHVFAEGVVTFVPSIAYQQKTLEFDQKHKGVPGGQDAEFSVKLPTLNVGLTVASSHGFYMALKWEKTLKEVDTSTDETDRTPFANILAIPDSEMSVSRRDRSITFGFNPWNNLNVFFGYMKGETELIPEPMCRDIFTPCQESNLAWFSLEQGDARYKQNYEEKGPFVGLSYALQVAEVGTVSFSGAYADMTGTFEDNGESCSSFGCEPFSYRGDANGLSLAVTWTQPLGDWSSYFIDIRRQSYSMDGSDRTGNATYGDVEVETDETMTGLTAGVQFYF